MITSKFEKKEAGNVEIVYTIPADLIAQTKTIVVSEMAKDITLPGFRKGMAPLNKVESSISVDKLNEHILSHLLPTAFSESVKEHKFTPAIYPKFEALKIGQGSDWDIKAVTCELPKVILADYKQNLKSTTTDELIKELPKVVKLKHFVMNIKNSLKTRLHLNLF